MKYNIDFSEWKLNYLSHDNINNYSYIFLTISTNKFSIINKKKYYIKLPIDQFQKYPIYNEYFVNKFIKIYKIPNVLTINSLCLYNYTTKSFSQIQFEQLKNDYINPNTSEYIGLIYDCKYYTRTLDTLPKLNKYDQYTILFQIYIILDLLKDIFYHNKLTINNVIYYEVPNSKRIKIIYIYNGQNMILYVKYIPYMKNLDQSLYFINNDYNNYKYGLPSIYHADINYFINNAQLFNNINATPTDTLNATSFYNFLQRNYNLYKLTYSDNDIVSEKTYNFDTYNLPKYPKKTLTIMTFNVFAFKCTDFVKVKETFDKYKPDIICTQENYTDKQPILPYDPFINYINVQCAGKGYEKMCVYQLKNTQSITNIKIINTESPDGITYNSNKTEQITESETTSYKLERTGIIFEYDGIKIANIHLDGGRFADLAMYYNACGGWPNYAALVEYKKELLKKIIIEKPDIIVGDFNTFYAVNEVINNDYHALNLDYIHTIYPSDKECIRLNETKPVIDEIINLISKEYYYMQPEDEQKYTSLKSKTIVDMIWYKKNGKAMPKGRSQILDISHHVHGNIYMISDHNPVIGTFMY